MKLLKIATVYQAYLDGFYVTRPELVSASFEAQKAALDHDAFGWFDVWSHALAPLGYETLEVSANVRPMQQAWARAHGLPAELPDWTRAVVKAQIEAFRPEVLFFDDYVTFDRPWIEAVRQANPSVKLVLGWCGAPLGDDTVLHAYDVVLSCIPELVSQFKAAGHRAELVRHAFEPRVLERIRPERAPDVDFSFVGSIVRTNRYHVAREHLLEALTDELPLTIFTPQHGTTWRDDARSLFKRALYEAVQAAVRGGVSERRLAGLPVAGKVLRWPGAPRRILSPRLRGRTQPGVFGLAMYETLRRSRATFNSHIDLSAASASNMRLFEATGAGACLVTDWKPDLGELFELDREVVTYRSAEECIEKVKYLLAHPAACEAIARAGQARTLRDHTFAHRADTLDRIIRRHLA